MNKKKKKLQNKNEGYFMKNRLIKNNKISESLNPETESENFTNFTGQS